MSESFSEKLKKFRKKAGLTQEELAHNTGYSIMTIRRWEWGENSPRIDEVKALAKALEVTEADLLNDPPPDNTGDWVIKIKVEDKFEQEVIDLTGNVQPIAQITSTPAGCAFTIQADWDMLTTAKELERLFKRIVKETYPAMRSNGIALGGIKD